MNFLASFATLRARHVLARPGHWLLLSLCWLALLSGCNNDDDPPAPAGLSYAMSSVIYELGHPIVPNRPSASGGAVERYSVAPELPAGLVLDTATGVISGTPTAVSSATVHVVTARNAAGTATARIQIEVRSNPAAPTALTYREPAVVYTVGEPISANAPASSGGPIDAYAIAPALPAGLALDPRTGVISGTPAAAAAEASYTVTGSNAAGQATTTLRIAVEAAVVAPASLSYGNPTALYVAAEAIVPNTPVVTGGAASSFSVNPPLPPGLSLNTQTGVIAGTPATMQPQAVYTITASNRAGSTDAQVRITVTARGSWTTASPMPAAMHYLSATTLTDGKVLATAGFGLGGPSTSAFLYDPATNVWTSTASMANARYEATATRLNDGRVLVAGGSYGATAEIYDPATGTWQAAPNMSQGRSRHTATLLPNGKVLVIGGTTSVPGAVSTAELYDPASNTWTVMATALAFPRGQHAATLLPGGDKILLVGGIGPGGLVMSAELFPVNDSGTSTPVSFPGGGANVAESVLLGNGNVLVTGTGDKAWRYDPATSAWTSSTMNAGRTLPVMTLLADGRVLVAGGFSGGARVSSAEIYNPDADVWTMAAPMSVARNGAAATLLGDGSVVVVGGSDSTSLDAVERYRP